MAHANRTAKSAKNWTDNELIAYNITISLLPPDKFFSSPDPPIDDIDSSILNSPSGSLDPALSDTAARYLGYLRLAANVIKESFAVDFAAETLKLLQFNERGTIVSTRFNLSLVNCGDAKSVAQADVCLIYRPTLVLLVVLADKTLEIRANVGADVVATAIAAFQFNNRKRIEFGLMPLDAMTIPCIAMCGTRPTFYLVPVTKDLSNAVVSGQFCTTQTQVWMCPTVLEHARNCRIDMENTEYRKLALRRFLAFKALAKSHWEQILEGIH